MIQRYDGVGLTKIRSFGAGLKSKCTNIKSKMVKFANPGQAEGPQTSGHVNLGAELPHSSMTHVSTMTESTDM